MIQQQVDDDHSEGGNTTLVLLEVVNHIPDDVHVVTEEWNIWKNLEREVLERESFLYRAGLVLLELVQVRPIGLLKLETNSGPVTLAVLGDYQKEQRCQEIQLLCWDFMSFIFLHLDPCLGTTFCVE